MGESFQENKYINRCLMYINKELTKEQCTDFEIDLLIDDQLREVYQRYCLLWRIYPRNEQILQVKDPSIIGIQTSNYKNSNNVLVLASCFLFLVCCGILFMPLHLTKENTLNYEYVSTKGHRSTVFLNDGSKVILNGDSKISYRLENSIRKVYLEGEAFFDVRHIEGQKFVVQHNELQVEVLGTKFSVNTKHTKKEILLLSGSILARFNNNEQLYLKPDEKLVYNSITGEVIREKSNITQEIQWRNNILMFKDEKLKDAILKIEQYYGYKFTTSNIQLLEMRITGVFENQSINEFVKSLSFITNCTIKQQGSVYLIY